jgi:hypothetical protein
MKLYLDTFAGKEADIESPFAPPPNGLVRLRHVNDGDHVTNLHIKMEKF